MMASNRLSGDFNPRSPDGERLNPKLWKRGIDPFQSTLPGWGATLPAYWWSASMSHFNPRSPDGERLAIPEVG